MIYRISRKEHPIPEMVFTNKMKALAYAKKFSTNKSGVPAPSIEMINEEGKVVGYLNLAGQHIFDHYEATSKYDKNNTTGVYLKLNKKTDEDILEHLAKQENKQGYIKELIRKDIRPR